MKFPRTLTSHLLAWTLGALVLVWASFVLVGYQTGMHEADELTDGHLASVASLLLAERDGGGYAERANPGTLSGQEDLKRHDYQQSLSILVWDASGKLLTRTGEAPLPPFTQTEGFQTLGLGTPPAQWRSFARWDDQAHSRKVMVLLSIQERDDLAEDIADQMAAPGLWLLPVVALVLGLAIRRGLRPLYALSRDVHALDVHNPVPLPDVHRQEELRAVVGSINTLAERYHTAMSRERELANELAHELRTPLASITLQARSLREMPAGLLREQALVQIERDALRAGQVLSDLLSLARASRTELAETAQVLDLGALAGEVLGEFAQLSFASGHDLALVSPGPFPVTGHIVLLGLALRNLVENALTHTPRGTLVEVRLDPQARWVQVSDSASGAVADGIPGGKGGASAGPESGLGLGLGLGHRVVTKIARIHGAVFAAVPPPAGFTTCYRMSFPAAGAEAPAPDQA
ncbi:MAG: two-component sensor histidine kinase [Comamonadaceae bacterium]|nr:MAG: two-component sensor histidine kinase [Comamonadaceae bacterium]